jgi:hypothetical protein
MNREPNKEIDILLRKLSGKQNGNIGAAEGNSSASGHAHLDADELNAYAQNALPGALRSRYTEHLADCISCRKLVTQLTLSSTVATVAPIEEEQPSRFKTLLGGLFTPLVIRYAVPAMAVILVVAIAWIVGRREPSYEQQVATTTTSRQPESLLEKQPTLAEAPNDSRAASRPQATPQAPERKAVPAEEGVVDRSAGNKVAEEPKEREAAAKRDEPAPAAPVTVVAPSAGAGATASVQPKAVSDAERNEPEAKKKAESDANNNRVQNANAINQDRRANEQQRSGPSEPKAVQRGDTRLQRNEALREVPRQRAPIAKQQDKDAASDDEAEVRTVGGHKFIKRGGVWVDARFDSASATTNVSRGSEQYRSLMGDEPGLRAIVEQFSGEVVVVWKARAYRIK